jgi:hypothetical protein
MSDTPSIAGSVVNGATGIAAFTFYAGTVGICERDGYLEVAFFAHPVTAELPSEGFLDGEKVTVIEVRTRDRNPGEPTRGRDRGPRVIIATVIPSPAT